tara:strand:+ start:7280 stop:7477 length:198 start_codon:yes stop_codon:yes gene_type:complete
MALKKPTKYITIPRHSRERVENEINEILKTKTEKKGFEFSEPIKLKKLNRDELYYFYRLVKFDLK